MNEVYLLSEYQFYNTLLGSKAPILALTAFPSKTNSLINFPVPGPFCIPQHAEEISESAFLPKMKDEATRQVIKAGAAKT